MAQSASLQARGSKFQSPELMFFFFFLRPGVPVHACHAREVETGGLLGLAR